jgi:hypothetical protein
LRNIERFTVLHDRIDGNCPDSSASWRKPGGNHIFVFTDSPDYPHHYQNNPVGACVVDETPFKKGDETWIPN